jgi:hypothetical protein
MYLKEIFPFIRVITGFWGDEVLDQDYSIFNDLDLVFTCNNDYKEFMNSAGIPAIVAGNCFDHLVFKDLKDQKVMNQKHDFVFAGTSGYRYNDHLKRYEDLVYQLSKSQLKAWIYEPPEPRIKKVSLKIKLKILATNVFSLLKISHLKTLKTIIETICEANVLSRFIDHTIKIKLNGPLPSSDPFYWSPKNRPPVKKLFPTKCSSPVFGLEYFSLLKSAKVVYNSSRDEAADYSNIRIFEVTGVGTCLITDKPDKIKEFFIPDEEVLTYTSNDECIEKVTYVLDHEEVRKQIATKGQARTMSEYTVTHFCEIIDKELRNFA